MSVSERFVRLPPIGQKLNGLSRSSIYELGQQHEGLLKKVDRTTLVDMPKFNEILANCPPATLRPPAVKLTPVSARDLARKLRADNAMASGLRPPAVKPTPVVRGRARKQRESASA